MSWMKRMIRLILLLYQFIYPYFLLSLFVPFFFVQQLCRNIGKEKNNLQTYFLCKDKKTPKMFICEFDFDMIFHLFVQFKHLLHGLKTMMLCFKSIPKLQICCSTSNCTMELTIASEVLNWIKCLCVYSIAF